MPRPGNHHCPGVEGFGCLLTMRAEIIAYMIYFLVDVSDIFYFFCSGRRESEAPGGAGRFFIENPTRGVGFSRRGRGREGVCGELGNFGGGGLNISFWARNVHQDLEGPRYPEYVMHIFYLKYSGTPKYGNMLGNPLPVGPVQQTTEIT